MRGCRVLVPLAVVAVALGAVALPSAPAQFEGGGAGPADLLDIGARQVRVGVDDGVARVYVARENFTGSDGVFVGYDPERGRMVVNERGQDQARADSLRLQVEHLVEFRDLDGDGVLTLGVDEVVQTWRPSDLLWRLEPIEATAQGHRIVAHGVMPEGGLVSIVLSTSGSYAAPEGVELDLADIDLGFDVHAPRMVGNGTSFALVVNDQQRGEVAGVPATGSFPWEQVAAAADGRLQANVTEADRRPGDAVRSETAFVTIAGSGAAAAAAAPGEAGSDAEGAAEPAAGAQAPPARAGPVLDDVACAFFFRCT